MTLKQSQARMSRTGFENLILQTALERAGSVLEFQTGSVTNEIFGLRFLASKAMGEGLVGTNLDSHLEALTDATRSIDNARRFQEIFEMMQEVQ